MRAMRAEQFSRGYEALKLADLQTSRQQTGKYWCESWQPASAPLDHTILLANFHIRGAASPGQTRSSVVGGRRNGFSRGLTRDVLGRLRRF